MHLRTKHRTSVSNRLPAKTLHISSGQAYSVDEQNLMDSRSLIYLGISLLHLPLFRFKGTGPLFANRNFLISLAYGNLYSKSG